MTALRATTHQRTDIVLDDLSDPCFSIAASKIFAAMAQASVPPLEPDRLREIAMARTGLGDFGAPDFSQPFQILCRSLREEADLSPVGKVIAVNRILENLCTRLRIEDLVKQHPEIRSIPIERPLIVAGMPRSGTTHLINLLASDPQLRFLPYWEAREPLPAPGDPEGEAGRRARAARTRKSLDSMHVAVPHFNAMHNLTAEDPLDDFELLNPIFSSSAIDNKWHVPRYGQWLVGTDQRPAYAFLKLMLQVLQWQRPGKRWVLKSAGHIENLGPLIDTFPDATVIITHRDPLTITASLATFLSYQARVHVARPDPSKIAAYWANRIEEHAVAAVRDRGLIPAAQSLDVVFSDFMADKWGTIERIYELAAQPMSEASRAALHHHFHTHPRGQHGTVRYALADLGLTNKRSAALRDYVERFQVPEDSW